MKDLFSDKTCTGCAACANACQRDAITMTLSQDGFRYPHIDPERCVSCGVCVDSCPLHTDRQGTPMQKAYGAFAKQKQVRAQSSSGGLFSVLAEATLHAGGVVFGAAFDGAHRVCHRRVERTDELKALRQSKYVQSDMRLIYRALERDCEADRQVLFVGTPCQIAGARTYLKKDYPRLLLAEVVCHGVPAEGLWQRYLSALEARYGVPARRVEFRSKRYGWKQHCMQIEFENGKRYIQKSQYDSWYRLFLGNLSLRESCFDCRFKGDKSLADLTLGDLWGASVICPELDGEQGSSLVVAQTLKGLAAIEAVGEMLEIREIPFAHCARYNAALVSSAPPHDKRALFTELASAGIDVDDLTLQCLGSISKGARFKTESFALAKGVLRRTGLLGLAKKMRKRKS